jgi:hypothetical protein
MKNLNYLLTCIIGSFVLIACSEKEKSESYKACFEFASDTMKAGDAISFTNCSENSSDYSWDFGDGTKSRLMEPDHIYSHAGSYQIVLFAGKDKNADEIVNAMDDADSVRKTIIIVPNKKSMDLTIKDGSSWTIENPGLAMVSGATVKLYENKNTVDTGNPIAIVTSDAEGKAIFYDLSEATYYLTVSKNDLSNLKDGYLIAGVFQTQAEVDSWANQSGSQVGGLKFSDINFDFLISELDKTNSAEINYDGLETIVRDITIGK